MLRLLAVSCALHLSIARLAAQSPLEALVNAGGTHTFTAGSTSSPAQYQWLKNGVPMLNATGASYSATNAVPRDMGIYSVAITTSTGTTTNPATRLTVASGYQISTLAGNARNFGIADGEGDAARFYGPRDLTLGSAGNLYVSDYANDRIRQVTSAGLVTTIATQVNLRDPTYPAFSSTLKGIVVDATGVIYVADEDAIRRVTQDGAVTLFAGSLRVSGSENGDGPDARFQGPQGLAIDRQGNLFVTDYTQRVRKISLSGTVTTVAGTAGLAGYADGPALSARFNNPSGLAVAATGTIYVADYSNNCVRKIAPDGSVSVFAGIVGSMGTEDGPPTVARFNYPRGITLDPQGNLYVTDSSNTIRRISPAGTVTTIAGAARTSGSIDGVGSTARFNQPAGIVADASGTLYIADEANNTIRLGRMEAELIAATTVTQQPRAFEAVVDQPMALSVVATGAPPFTYQWLKNGAVVSGATSSTLQIQNVRTSDAATYSVVVTGDGGAVTSEPAVVTVFDEAVAPRIQSQAHGTINVTAGEDTAVFVDVVGRPTPALQWSRNGAPISGATNAIFSVKRAQVSDAGTYTVEVANSVGHLMGDSVAVVVNPKITNLYVNPTSGRVAVGGTIAFIVEATLGGPSATYQWLKNDVPISGQSNATLTLAKVQARDGGSYSIRVGNGSGFATSTPVPLAVFSGYTVSTIASRPGNLGNPITGFGIAVDFGYPEGLARDQRGNLYVADTHNHVIRRIDPAGNVTSFAGFPGPYGNVNGVGSAARFYEPKGLAFDAEGNLYVADCLNAAVRRIAPDGTVTTAAGNPNLRSFVDGPTATAGFVFPRALVVNPAGDIFVLDSSAVRKITPGGVVSTLVPANPDDPANKLSDPSGLAIDSAGNLYIADAGNFVVRKLTPSGALSIVAGQMKASGTTDGSVATALLSGPRSLALDASGNLFIGDGNRLRRLGTDGLVITLAGSNSGWANGTGAEARFSVLYVLTLDAAGNMYIMDGSNAALRLATPPTYPLTFPTTIATAPSHLAVRAGAPAALSVAAAGTSPFTYQWLRNGVLIPGATDATLTFASPQALDAGNYTVVVTGAGGAVTSPGARLTVQTPARITNLAIRTGVRRDAPPLIAGFVVTGGSSLVLLRGVGPALSSFGVADVLPDPQLKLYTGTTLLAQNNNWSEDTAASTTAEATLRVSFPLAPNSRDAALLKTLAAGAYTAQVSAADGGNGIALFELYDLATGGSTGRLVNVSASTHVGTGENILIAGFTLSGSESIKLLIRGVGPGLRAYGVEDTLVDPQIAVYFGSFRWDENDDWGQSAAEIAAVSAQVGAFPLPAGSKDAAKVVRFFGAGSFTVQLSGVSNCTGTALLEIYEVP